MWSELQELKVRTDALEAVCKELVRTASEGKEPMTELVKMSIDSDQSGAPQFCVNYEVMVYPDKITSQRTDVNCRNPMHNRVQTEVLITNLVEPLPKRRVLYVADIWKHMGPNHHDPDRIQQLLVKLLLDEPL